MSRFFSKNQKTKKYNVSCDKFNVVNVEGDDGVGKTTFIKKLIKNTKKNIIHYIHMPTNFLITINKNNKDYFNIFEGKLKYLESYKDNLTKKFKQEDLMTMCCIGYKLIESVMCKNCFIIQDRGILSNVVYDSIHVLKNIKNNNFEEKINKRLNKLYFLYPEAENIIKNTLFIFLDNRKFFYEDIEIKLNTYNLMRFKGKFMNNKYEDRIKQQYLILYYLLNKYLNHQFENTLLLGKNDYYNKFVERLELFKLYELKKTDR